MTTQKPSKWGKRKDWADFHEDLSKLGTLARHTPSMYIIFLEDQSTAYISVVHMMDSPRPSTFLPAGPAWNTQPAGPKITLSFPCLYLCIYICASALTMYIYYIDATTWEWKHQKQAATRDAYRVTKQQRMAARRALEWIRTSKARLVFRYEISTCLLLFHFCLLLSMQTEEQRTG